MLSYLRFFFSNSRSWILGEALYLIRTYSCDSYVFTAHTSSRVYLSRNARAFCRSNFALIARAVPQWRAGAVDVPRRHSIRASGTINYSENLNRNYVFISGKQLCFLLPLAHSREVGGGISRDLKSSRLFMLRCAAAAASRAEAGTVVVDVLE